MSIPLDRRKLLVGTAVGGGLLLGWSLLPRHYPDPLVPGPDEVVFDAWLKIGKDGIVTVAVPQLEMGQGVTTVLPQIVAVELGADWQRIAVAPAPVSEIYVNAPLAGRWAEMWMPALAELAESEDGPPGWLARQYAERHRFMVTADGTALAAYEAPLRAAAASARTLLAMAAAQAWGVRWQDCTAKAGFIHHGEQQLPFGELVEAAAKFTPPDRIALLADPAVESPILPAGTALAFPRLDLPGKVTGATQFAGDIRLPDMVYAAIHHGPIGDCALGDVDDKHAAGITGFIRLVRGERWLAAVATDWWAAERALTAIAPRFKVHAPAASEHFDAALDTALRGKDGWFSPTATIASWGDADAALAEHTTLSQRYDIGPSLHATLETASATARLRSDGLLGKRLELWIATQAPEAARRAAARAAGVSVRDVVLYPLAAGGSFDARLEVAHAAEVAQIASEVGRPVQLTWSRWQEHLAGRPRPPVAAIVSARTDSAGQLLAWKLRAAAPAAAREFGARVFGETDAITAAARAGSHADPLALQGAVPPYGIGACSIQHVPVATGLPSGRLRGNAHGYTAFFTESFIDELAGYLHREPLAFRMAMLGGDPRLAACLQQVSALSGWNGGNDSSGQGMACHRIGSVASGGCIAAVAIARRSESGVRVDKISAVVDIGRIVNVDIARQQIEGGLIFGIGLALGASTGYVRGLPTIGRLGGLSLPLLGDCPDIQVEMVESEAPPFDPGELGVAVAAPAIANALAGATGLRFRKLPLGSDE